MRKDQKAMMRLLCGHRRKLCVSACFFAWPLSLYVARIAARHLLDEGGIVFMTVTEIP